MAAIAWSDVTAIAADLSATSAGAQTAILAYVNGNGCNVDAFDGEAGDVTKFARMNLAAHLGTTIRYGAGGGPIASQSAGGLSRSFGSWSGSSLLGTTGYGRMFLTLARAGAGGAALT